MARNILKLDTSGMTQMLKRLEDIGGNAQKAVSDSLEQAAQKIHDDTIEAIAAPNLPAKGRYSTGKTRESVIDDTHVRWEGSTGWVPVGFDFAKEGAGGFLITGTPKMRPDAALHRMYKQKKYMSEIQEQMWNTVSDYVTGVKS